MQVSYQTKMQRRAAAFKAMESHLQN